MKFRPIGLLPPDAEARIEAALKLSGRERVLALEAAERTNRRQYPRHFRSEGQMAKVQVEGRLAFAQGIFEKTAVGDGEPAFNCVFIIDPKSKYVKTLDDAVIAAAQAQPKWKGTDKKSGRPMYEIIVEKLINDGKVAWLKDDYCNKNGEPFDGFEDNYALKARSGVAPLVIDRDKTRLTKADGKPYSGCYVIAQVEIWAQDNQYGRRINSQLKGVQFLRDGDAFGGGRPADEDDFEDLSVEEDDLAG